MCKIYAYCRTARAEGNDIEEQCELIKNYCKRKGMHIEVFFCDDGVSAHKLNREELDKLFDVLKDGDIVVTKDISRFARGPENQEFLINKIHNMGVEIVWANESNDDDRPPSIETWLHSRWNNNVKLRDE